MAHDSSAILPALRLTCRPRNQKEIDANSPSSVVVDNKAGKVTTKVKTAGKVDSKTYAFDNVFGTDSSQLQVYEGEHRRL